MRNLEPVEGRDYQDFDSEITGSAIRIYRSGRKAFTLDYRINGRQRRYKLDAWPEWATTAASERAMEIRLQQLCGEQPLQSPHNLRRTIMITWSDAGLRRLLEAQRHVAKPTTRCACI